MNINVKKPLRLGAPAGGDTGFVVVQAEDAAHHLNFSLDTANDLILALQQAKQAIHTERQKAGKPPIQTAIVKEVVQIEYGVDVLNQVMVLRTKFKDGSSQDLPIGRKQIPDIHQFLNSAQQTFEAQDKSSKQ